MLVIFSLSITPRVFLHELLADHQDMVLKGKQQGDYIGKDGFTCDINDLVATSPFTQVQETVQISSPTVYHHPVAWFRETSFQFAPPYIDSRGPPSLG